MIKNIKIQNFKPIKELEVRDFRQVNFFVGKANIGKTSILEALYLFVSENADDILKSLENRNMIAEDDIFQGFFFNYDLQNKPKIEERGNKTLVIDHGKTEKYNIDVVVNNMGDPVGVKSMRINEITFDHRQEKENDQEATRVSIKKNFATPSQIQFENFTNKPPKPSEADFIYSNSSNEKSLRENLKLIFSNKSTRERFQELCSCFSGHTTELLFIGNKIMVQDSTLENTINFKLMGEGFKKYIAILASKLAKKNIYLLMKSKMGCILKILKFY